MLINAMQWYHFTSNVVTNKLFVLKSYSILISESMAYSRGLQMLNLVGSTSSEIKGKKRRFPSFKELLGNINNEINDSSDEEVQCNTDDPYAVVARNNENIDGEGKRLLKHLGNILGDPMCDEFVDFNATMLNENMQDDNKDVNPITDDGIIAEGAVMGDANVQKEITSDVPNGSLMVDVGDQQKNLSTERSDLPGAGEDEGQDKSVRNKKIICNEERIRRDRLKHYLLPPCNCKRKCIEQVPEANRHDIHRQFWTKS